MLTVKKQNLCDFTTKKKKKNLCDLIVRHVLLYMSCALYKNKNIRVFSSSYEQKKYALVRWMSLTDDSMLASAHIRYFLSWTRSNTYITGFIVFICMLPLFAKKYRPLSKKTVDPPFSNYSTFMCKVTSFLIYDIWIKH